MTSYAVTQISLQHNYVAPVRDRKSDIVTIELVDSRRDLFLIVIFF